MELKLKHLKKLIEYINAANKNADEFKQLGFNVYETKVFGALESAINLILVLYFGEQNAELFWDFVYNSENNQFESIEELYDYLKDSYSQLVRKDSALTLDQLRELFPQEKMFEYFQEVINKHV